MCISLSAGTPNAYDVMRKIIMQKVEEKNCMDEWKKWKCDVRIARCGTCKKEWMYVRLGIWCRNVMKEQNVAEEAFMMIINTSRHNLLYILCILCRRRAAFTLNSIHSTNRIAGWPSRRLRRPENASQHETLPSFLPIYGVNGDSAAMTANAI